MFSSPREQKASQRIADWGTVAMFHPKNSAEIGNWPPVRVQYSTARSPGEHHKIGGRRRDEFLSDPTCVVLQITGYQI